jgi:hypothetical protein
VGAMLTFSCRRCLSSFSSRYVRFDKTGVLKGFIIFLMATAWLVSWSLAELRAYQCVPVLLQCANVPDEAKGSHAHRLQVSVSMRRQSSALIVWGRRRRTCL